MSRTLVVGDIHGALRSLLQVLKKSKYDLEKDNLIFLGDYVDGWSHSAEVIDFLIGLKEKVGLVGRDPEIAVICLMGNHDEWARDFLVHAGIDLNWLNNGGYTTIESYKRFWEGRVDDTTSLDAHRKFLTSLHYHYLDSKNRAFVHAGCNLETGVQSTIEYLKVWDRNMWKKVMSGASCDAHKEVFIGHTTTGMYKLKAHMPEAESQKDGLGYITVPMNRQNVWNLDTGSGWEGRLTIMDVDTKEFWQSDLSKDLYPGEGGRR